jgi:FAD binding domain
VLGILARHRDGEIRAFGAKHSWSGIAVSRDVSLDMSLLNEVRPDKVSGNRVRAGAGATLQHVLDRLHAETDQTLPTLGVIKKTDQEAFGLYDELMHSKGVYTLLYPPFFRRVLPMTRSFP